MDPVKCLMRLLLSFLRQETALTSFSFWPSICVAPLLLSLDILSLPPTTQPAKPVSPSIASNHLSASPYRFPRLDQQGRETRRRACMSAVVRRGKMRGCWIRQERSAVLFLVRPPPGVRPSSAHQHSVSHPLIQPAACVTRHFPLLLLVCLPAVCVCQCVLCTCDLPARLSALSSPRVDKCLATRAPIILTDDKDGNRHCHVSYVRPLNTKNTQRYGPGEIYDSNQHLLTAVSPA